MTSQLDRNDRAIKLAQGAQAVEDDTKPLPSSGHKPSMNEIIYAAIPRSGMSNNTSNSLGGSNSLRNSYGSGGFSLTSPRSYDTAVSTFSSYKTALLSAVSEDEGKRTSKPGPTRRGPVSFESYHFHDAPLVDYGDLMEFVDCIMAQVEGDIASKPDSTRDELKIDLSRSLHDFAYEGKVISEDSLADRLYSIVVKYATPMSGKESLGLKTNTAAHLHRFIKGQKVLPGASQVFSSAWLTYLHSRGILPDPSEELDWSGRGQHVEYRIQEEKDIPLKSEKILGHSATALVESVMCRRIRLARKLIRCNRRLSKEDAITEVEHLQRLHHAHIVRIVGTYTLRNNLAILLYPAADQNLEEFIDDTEATAEQDRQFQAKSLCTFFGCLSSSIDFLHKNNVKHMDIKPKNILIRPIEIKGYIEGGRLQRYKVYIADFGIARSYKSATEVETDSPTSYTRTYAAPEVVQQDTRGFPADIFSLGCVFMEIYAAIVSLSQPEGTQLKNLQQARCSHSENDTSYQANIDAVWRWYSGISLEDLGSDFRGALASCGDFKWQLGAMLHHSPYHRPSAKGLMLCTKKISCGGCNDGPEPFEAAKPLSD